MQLREVDVEPLLLPLRDRPAGGQGLDRAVYEGLQLAPLRHDGAVLLVRDDLARNRAVGARLRLLLRRDDRDVHHEGLAAPVLDRREGGGRRLVDERLLHRMQPVLHVVEPRRHGLGAHLELAQSGEALRHLALGRDLLRDEDALVRVEVRGREADRPLTRDGDRRLLEREVERLRSRPEEEDEPASAFATCCWKRTISRSASLISRPCSSAPEATPRCTPSTSARSSAPTSASKATSSSIHSGSAWAAKK